MHRFIAVLVALSGAGLWAQAERPTPTHADIHYGEHERNVLDLYLADASGPTPLVVYIHGGGFRAGDKRGVSARMVRLANAAGMSVASLNYPLTDTASFPRQMRDPARAIQYLRHNAKKWNLDKTRFGATGGSAGAGISLWIGFHDDMADASSADPIARESTRLTAMAVSGAQISYDPRWISKHIGGRAHEHPALPPLWGVGPDEMETPRAHKIFHDVSPINYLSADDPPVWVIYREPDGDLPPDARPGQGIHHPRFGQQLKQHMSKVGIECIVKHSTDYPGGKVDVWPRDEMDDDIVAFFQRQFGL
jgi:acetyl esterase/lipase